MYYIRNILINIIIQLLIHNSIIDKVNGINYLERH